MKNIIKKNIKRFRRSVLIIKREKKELKIKINLIVDHRKPHWIYFSLFEFSTDFIQQSRRVAEVST